MKRNNKAHALKPLDTPVYRYWQALFMAFYSSRLYVDVMKRWRGYGMLYLLLVIVIAMVPLSIKTIMDFNDYMDEQLIRPIDELPPLIINNGELIALVPQPYFIKNNQGEVVAIVDTTGAITQINRLFPHVMLLVTKDTLYFRMLAPAHGLFSMPSQDPMEVSISTMPLNKQSNEIFIASEWLKSSGVLKYRWMGDVLIYPMFAGLVFGVYTLLMLLIGFLGQLASMVIFKFNLSFKEACRLLMVSSTPQVLLLFVLLAFNVSLPGGGLFYMVLLSMYFSYAVLSVKRHSKKMVFS